MNNDDLTAAGRGVRLAVVVVFVALAIVVVAARRRAWFGQAVTVLSMWTIGYWAIRGSGILLGEYTASFKAVHTLLMAVSIGLAAVVLWSGRAGDPG